MTHDSHVVRSGSGAPIVLIHGVGLDLGMWDELVHTLADRFELIRYDMLGHGATPLRVPDPDLDTYVGQLHRVLQEQGLLRPYIVGYSMGGLVAGRFAALYPGSLEKLVLMSTISRRNASERQAVLDRLEIATGEENGASAQVSIERWFTPSFIRSHGDRIAAIRQQLLSNRKDDFLAAYRIFAHADEALMNAAPRIKCPTLIMTGEHDPGSTPAMANALSEAIGGSTMTVIPEQKHMLPVEGASQVAAILTLFFEQDHRTN